jgi:hypothetical protein
MIRKPFVGKKIVVLNSSKCCESSHEVGSEGVIGEIGYLGSLPVTIGKLKQWHCLKCLGPRR